MTNKKNVLILYFFLCWCLCFPLVAEDDAAPTPPTTQEEILLAEDLPAAPEGTSPFFQEFISMMMMLALIIVILIGMAWVLKRLLHQRMVNMNKGSVIKVLERRTLAAKTAVYVLEIGGKGFIVGESPQGLHKIGELAVGETPPVEESSKKSFKSFLKQDEG